MTRIYHLMLGLLMSIVACDAQSQNEKHSDYVPDKQTAEAIGRAVLTAKFGTIEVDKQLPLTVIKSYGNVWIVQGNASLPNATGGGMAVWIDQRSGCIVNLMAYMK